MIALIVSPQKAAEISTLNAGNKRIEPVEDANGALFLMPDLLTDCGPGQTWEAYAGILQSLPSGAVEPKTTWAA